MTTKRTPPKVIDPVYGNAPDIPPEAMRPKQVADDSRRALAKAAKRSKDATNSLLSESERTQAEAWASSAHATLAGYMTPIERAMDQYSRGGKGNADPVLRKKVADKAELMLKSGYKQHQLCAVIRSSIHDKWTTKHIREVLKEAGIWIDPPKK
jgi:hypothetical protein